MVTISESNITAMKEMKAIVNAYLVLADYDPDIKWRKVKALKKIVEGIEEIVNGEE